MSYNKRDIRTQEASQALNNFPYFVLRNEMDTGFNLYTKELLQIKRNYLDYNKGAIFQTEGAGGDYIPSNLKYKHIYTLINKEARFMYSRPPKIEVLAEDVEEDSKEQIEQYQKLLDKVFKKSKFNSKLLKSAKDCFIGKRIAMLVDYSQEAGIMVHFYSSMQFYHEVDVDTKELSKFVSFEQLKNTNTKQDKLYLVNKYVSDGITVSMSSIVYDGGGRVQQEIVGTKDDLVVTGLDRIPAVVVLNDGTLEDTNGVSEVESLADMESGYSQMANADIDSNKKGMNPIRYTVDMNPVTTQSLSSSAGSYWDLQHDQTIDDPNPQVGTLAPSMAHTEPVKVTLDRIKTTMYSIVDMPNISEETMKGMITSGKTLEALYFPLEVRCDEKMLVWIPALELISHLVIQFALLNKQDCITRYSLTSLEATKYTINIEKRYALLKDEETEKNQDLAEIETNARSRKSYIKKWRSDEFRTDEQIDEELMQIARENNMFDAMGAVLQKAQKKDEIDEGIEGNIDKIETKETLEM